MKMTMETSETEMEAVAPRHLPQCQFLLELDDVRAEALGVELHHEEATGSRAGRDGRRRIVEVLILRNSAIRKAAAPAPAAR